MTPIKISRADSKQLIVLAIALAIVLKLFLFGITLPLGFRVRGDAHGYLTIADRLADFSAVWTYAGDRTIGFPFFEFLIAKAIALFTPNKYVLTWINAIGVALLAIHLAAAWLLSRWALATKLVKSFGAVSALFIFYATYPALVGHTTSPLSDTFAVDLVVCALAALQAALGAGIRYKIILLAVLSAFLFGFSILVRPGCQFGVAAGLAASFLLSFLSAERRKSVLVVGAVGLGCALLLAPYYYNCTQKYGTVCLQAPTTFTPIASAQAGLRGARILWQKQALVPGQIPILPDDAMVANYYQRCRLTSIVGLDETSLTGCLVTRPLALPGYAVKKWIGLFDHVRFTPYLEEATPFWLRCLSRAYDSLAWTGLAMFFLALASTAKSACRLELRQTLTSSPTPLLLVVFSMVMLAQHTLLHIEDRYGFPLIPLCVIMLVMGGERMMQDYRASGYRKIWAPAAFGIAAWTLFVAQTIAWDNKAFY